MTISAPVPVEPAPAEPEPALWARAVAGEADAFGALFDRHRDRVFGHALRSLASPHDAEDVTAVVFLELWRHRNRVQPVNGSLIGWLLVTTNNVCRNHVRSARRYRHALSQLSLPRPQHDHADDVLNAIERSRHSSGVRTAFGRLSARDQHILTLCVLEELTHAEAASALNIPIGTVKSRLFRAKKRMSDDVLVHDPDSINTWSSL